MHCIALDRQLIKVCVIRWIIERWCKAAANKRSYIYRLIDSDCSTNTIIIIIIIISSSSSSSSDTRLLITGNVYLGEPVLSLYSATVLCVKFIKWNFSCWTVDMTLRTSMILYKTFLLGVGGLNLNCCLVITLLTQLLSFFMLVVGLS